MQCEALTKQLGDRVAFPKTCQYADTVASYWSLKEVDLQPQCVVLPESAEEVSWVVQILSAGKELGNEHCQFAIRGGG